MFTQNFKGTIGKVSFSASGRFTDERAKEYVMDRLENGGYKGCIIKEVYFNERLMFENIKV